MRPIVVKAHVVPGLKYDLLLVKGLNKCGYAVYHHPGPDESDVYALINKKMDKAKSFPFMREHSSLFYLKLEQMSAKHFEKQSGYRKLGHASFRNIRDTIKCVDGLESLKHMTCNTHVKCPSCMIGKATLEDLPKAKKVMTKPLYQLHMDSFSSSIEGYFHALVLVDAATGYRWIYCMKTKDDVLKVVKRWYGDIADLRAKHKLVVLMQDNAGEYKSGEILQFLDSKGTEVTGISKRTMA